MYKGYLVSITISLLLLLPPMTADAQWSKDPAQNLGIGVGTGDQALPKIVETSDGGCYITWFDNRSGDYCVYMQRLNSVGEAQFAPNGMLISSHPQMTWLVDYDLTVDKDDNAVVVFCDIRNGGTNELDVFAYKIGPDGAFLWGANGVSLSETVNTEFEPAPKVTATAAGNFVVGWAKSGSGVVCFQKLSAAGQKMWGSVGVTLTGVGTTLSAPDLAPADNDKVVVFWKDSFGPPWAPTTYLYTQKFDENGNEEWTSSGVNIYDKGGISAWAYPTIYSDEKGGAFYTWYDAPSLSEFNVWVQHVDSSGNELFPHNGSQASTNTQRLHMYPTLSYLSASDEVFVFWVEENTGQSQYGLYGQKFSSTGVRLWTDDGMEYIRLGSHPIDFVVSAPGYNSIYIGFFEGMSSPASEIVNAFRVKPDGSMIGKFYMIGTSPNGTKDDLVIVATNENRALLTWSDTRNTNHDIYAQNINPDGAIGNCLTSTPGAISAATGGSVDISLDAGVNYAGRNYMILGGVTGIAPGIALPGGSALLPIRWDPMTDLVLDMINSTLFQKFAGQLDSKGAAAAKFSTGPIPTVGIGLVLNFAYCLNKPFDFASNHVEVLIDP